VDHIHGGGTRERETATIGLHKRVKKEGFPRDKYRVLCYNCNCARHVYKKCPHGNV